VTDEWDGSRIDRLLRAILPHASFKNVQILIRKRLVLLNGRRVPGGARLERGDIVEIDAVRAGDFFDESGGKPEKAGGGSARRADPRRGSSVLPAEWGLIGRDIDILYEDGEVMSINKPRGLVVQPGNRKERGSLLDLLEEYRSRKDEKPPIEPLFPYTPVHRLDRETTGVLLVAKTRRAARELSGSFAGGHVKKVYLAVVEGAPQKDSGTIDEPLVIEKGRRSRAEPRPGGKAAFSKYRVLERMAGKRALLEIGISTGRTHQIRAHLASINIPVSGDTLYGRQRWGPAGDLLLHAWKVIFPHPSSGEMIEVTAPPPPEIMK